MILLSYYKHRMFKVNKNYCFKHIRVIEIMRVKFTQESIKVT